MVTFEFPFTYDDYINPHFRPLKPHLRNLALEIREEVLEWKFERLCEKCEDWNWIQEFCFPMKIFLSNKFFKVSKTCKSSLKCLFDKLFCVKPVLKNFFQFIELHETNFFILIVKNTFSIESQEILIRIEWDLFHCDLEEEIFHMISS